MSNFNSNNLDNDLIPWQFDGSVNNSFSSNNQSSINASSSQSCNLSNSNLSNNLCTNYSVNNVTNFNHQTNLTPLTSNHLNSNCYPATFNSSSNSSIALSTNEFDIYNQQNLVTNDSNLIPSFYQTFSQDVNKETNSNSIIIENSPAAHHLINPSFNQAINSTTNHYFNSQQQANYRLNSNVQQQHNNQFLSTNVEHDRNLFYNHNIKENIKIEHDLVDDDQRDVKRKTNNERERERVRKLNKGFDDLKRTFNTVMPSTSNQRMTKLQVLETALDQILDLEGKVERKQLDLANARSNH